MDDGEGLGWLGGILSVCGGAVPASGRRPSTSGGGGVAFGTGWSIAEAGMEGWEGRAGLGADAGFGGGEYCKVSVLPTAASSDVLEDWASILSVSDSGRLRFSERGSEGLAPGDGADTLGGGVPSMAASWLAEVKGSAAEPGTKAPLLLAMVGAPGMGQTI